MANGKVPYPTEFFAERERSRQQINQEAAYAAQIAESLGYYTPELESKVLAPLGKSPTIAENLIGAPVRGLGKLIGSERLQQVGAPQAFDLGIAQEPPTAPNFPPGTDPALKKQLSQMAIQLGFKPPIEDAGVVPDMPSEVSGGARLKTKSERAISAEREKRAWEFMAEHYLTEQERQAAQADIQLKQNQAQYYKARAIEFLKKARTGPNPNEWALIKAEAEKGGESYSTVAARFRAMSKNPAAIIQAYNYAKNHNQLPDPTMTLAQFKAMWERAGWDPIKLAYQMHMANPFTVLEDDPQKSLAAIVGLTTGFVDLSAEVDRMLVEAGKEPLDKVTTLPEELEAVGITPEMIPKLKDKYGYPSNAQTVQILLNYIRSRGKLGNGKPK